MVFQDTLTISTKGRETIEISQQVDRIVTDAGVRSGLCHVFIQHTSASLILCENADPLVRADLERFMSALVKDGDPMFQHTTEGDDDMPAHIRNILTTSSLTLPVSKGRCALGTWQGIYLWEHRYRGHSRRVVVTVYGDD
ncbi:MAG TPA: secondary thiamine-phosphate synthase enzyme YjbQ [Gammaproteobacteria bacterium]|nr:secondary thiamine-phosphate synthase enzyme YjbQ [Gammaproteobacteria bacterium]